MKPRWIILLCAFLVRASTAGSQSGAERHFQEAVKPLLDLRCVSCHGAEKQKGGLRLDSRASAVKGGDSGPSIVPGKPGESLLLQAVMHSRKDLEMPPKEKLSAKDIEVLERWIREGAPWLERAASTEVAKQGSSRKMGDAWSDPANPIVRIFGGQRLDLWSLKPVKHSIIPKVRRNSWPRNGIDYFVLGQLEKLGLKPAREADRRTLARRLYFDLTGLPPSPEEMRTFLKDIKPGAYERLVDKLLDSPRYGEHAARQWLDVVRYSDSNGFDWDEFRPRAWRFRDYVIRAFNSDKPFDQFVKEQLAGDEMVAGAPKNAAEQEMLIATGYLRLGPQDNSAALFNEQARSRAELMADLVETTSSAFLGMTMACCRCHDHKYDPLSQADHFRMRAFFEGVKHADDLPLDLAGEQERIRKQIAALEEEMKAPHEAREKLASEVKQRLCAQRLAALDPEKRMKLEAGKHGAGEELAKQIEALEKEITPSDKEVREAFTAEEKNQDKLWADQIDALKKARPSFATGLIMTDAEGVPAPTKILYQGDYKQERDTVDPGFISVLDPNRAAIKKGANPKTTGRRLTLAEWIVSPENPFAARVMVNRVWQWHFGKGIVATPNDFGLAGDRPVNPELLDYLASEFVRGGWSVKNLRRLIVTSAAYRQASLPAAREQESGLRFISLKKETDPSAVDGGNRFVWRQNMRRLTAEQLRDALLAVSAQLLVSTGGPPVWPALPADVLTANPALLDDNAEKTKGWYPSPADQQNVRSVYTVQKRTVRAPFLETFDLPENATSCPRRNESIVAPQALSLLNGETALQAAKAMADKIEKEAGTPESKIRRIFELALQRKPTDEEAARCGEFLTTRGAVDLCRAILNLNEFIYVD